MNERGLESKNLDLAMELTTPEFLECPPFRSLEAGTQGLSNTSTMQNNPTPNSSIRSRQTSSTSLFDDSLFDEDPIRPVKVHDLLMITKLCAYISKYETTRCLMRQQYPLFFLMEHLTVPTVIPEIRKWAGSCMRNAVRTATEIPMKRCGLITCSNTVHVSKVSSSCDHCQIVLYCRYVSISLLIQVIHVKPLLGILIAIGADLWVLALLLVFKYLIYPSFIIIMNQTCVFFPQQPSCPPFLASTSKPVSWREL